MVHPTLIAALGLLAATAPVSAQDPHAEGTAAPSAPPGARYCMRVEAVTGSRVERIECWTREQWFDQGVDVDRDWPREGVRVLG